MIALIIVGALTLLCGGGIAIGVYYISQNEDVQRGFRAIGAGMRMIGEAMNAPGTAELRGAGCQTAMVMTPEMIDELLHAIELDAGSTPNDLGMPLVICQLAPGRTLTCEDAARTYGAAVSPQPAEFMLQVQTQGSGANVCQGVYSPDGQRLRDFSASEGQGFDQVGEAFEGSQQQ